MLSSDCLANKMSSADNIDACKWPKPGSAEIDIAQIYGGQLTTVN
jgi:hypothetical protein